MVLIKNIKRGQHKNGIFQEGILLKLICARDVEYNLSQFCLIVINVLPVRTIFYPTAIKGCWGIVFTHGLWMGGWVGGR